MENPNRKCNDTEKTKDINFQKYFSMVKNDEMPWKLFIEIIIILLDNEKSKMLIFDLLEEIKGFREQEAKFKDKLKMS